MIILIVLFVNFGLIFLGFISFVIDLLSALGGKKKETKQYTTPLSRYTYLFSLLSFLTCVLLAALYY